jgi:uncharacterized membrane protein YkvA (DUF1232 family)
VLRGSLIALGIAAVLWLVAVVILMAAGRRSAARELATLIPNLVRLFRGLLGDRRVPWQAKAWIAIAVAWVVSPIDLIPEFLPIVGPLDDAIVAALVLRYVVKRTDPEILAEHWRGDPATLRKIVGTRVTGSTARGSRSG